LLERREHLKLLQEERRRDLEKQQFGLLSRHLSERDALKQLHDADNTGVVSTRLARQPKGLLAFLSRITGIQAAIARRQEKQDQLRTQQQQQQQEALKRRHDREMQEFSRKREALESLEARENAAAERAQSREEFQKVAALVRKPPGREVTPEFQRVAKPPEVHRTGTDDAKAPEQKAEKGKLASLFTRLQEKFRNLQQPEPEPPKPEPPKLREHFEKAQEQDNKPGFDFTEEFNRYVQNRLEREEREPDNDPGPEPDDPKSVK
jgi:hypothetical protein